MYINMQSSFVGLLHYMHGTEEVVQLVYKYNQILQHKSHEDID